MVAVPHTLRGALRSLGLPKESFSMISRPFVPTVADFTGPMSVWLDLGRADPA